MAHLPVHCAVLWRAMSRHFLFGFENRSPHGKVVQERAHGRSHVLCKIVFDLEDNAAHVASSRPE
jgi:hypothetical protein